MIPVKTVFDAIENILLSGRDDISERIFYIFERGCFSQDLYVILKIIRSPIYQKYIKSKKHNFSSSEEYRYDSFLQDLDRLLGTSYSNLHKYFPSFVMDSVQFILLFVMYYILAATVALYIVWFSTLFTDILEYHLDLILIVLFFAIGGYTTILLKQLRRYFYRSHRNLNRYSELIAEANISMC